MDMTKQDIPTSELLKELQDAGAYEEYREAHQDCFIETPLHILLNKLVAEKRLKKIRLFHEAGISEVYGYQIFSGKKRPERNKLLSITIPMKLTLDETQNLLKAAGYPLLYPKHEADGIVMYGILHEMMLSEINELLYRERIPSL